MRSARWIAVAGLLAGLSALPGAAVALTHHTASRSNTYFLAAGKTATYNVAYPYALKYGNAKYSCKAKKLQLKPPPTSAKPKLGKVKILSKGSALGGSVCRVKVQNSNVAPTAPVRIRITTTTSWTT